jgi:hypothetical protein
VVSEVGGRLLKAFESAGITDKAQIAEKLGFKSSKAVYKVVNGSQELSFDSLRRFRENTGRSIDWLLVGEVPEPDEETETTDDPIEAVRDKMASQFADTYVRLAGLYRERAKRLQGDQPEDDDQQAGVKRK